MSGEDGAFPAPSADVAPGDTPPLELPATFRTSKGMRIFLYVGGLAICALFVYVGFIMPFCGEKTGPLWVTAFLVLISLAMCAVGIGGALNVHRQRLVITKDYIEFREFVKVRRLALADIEGFRPSPRQNGIAIYPKGGGKPITPGYMERRAEIKAWVAGNLVDLNARDAEREEKEILADEELGLSEEERRFALARARGWCRLLNGAGMIVTFWAFFYPRP